MCALVRLIFCEGSSPDCDTILEADGHDGELKNGLWVHVVVCPFRSQAGKRFADTNSLGCCDKNKFIPNDRRRVAKLREFDFPLYVFRLAPFKGRVSVWCHSCSELPPPLAPLLNRIQRLAKRPPGNNDPIAAKRNAKDQGAMFRQKNIVMRRGCPVSGAFSTRLAKRISQASIDTANPYSFLT